MAQRQMFVRATLQFEFRKKIFDARVQALIVRDDYHDVSAFIQQFLTPLQSRNGIARVLEDMQHRDDVIIVSELNVFERAVMYGEAGLVRHVLADVL